MSTSIASFLDISVAYNPCLAADAQSLIFLSTQSGLPQVWRVGIPEAGRPPLWPDQLTFGGDRVQGVWLSPTSAGAIFARDEGGSENAQLYYLAFGAGQERNLTAGFGSAMHGFGTWSADGGRFLFSANRRDKARFDLYEQELGGPAKLVWENDDAGYLRDITYAPAGHRLALSRVASGSASALFELDLALGAVRPLTTVQARYAVVAYAEGGAALIVRTDLGADFVYLARLDLETLELTPLAQPRWDVECGALAPDGRRLAYVVNEGGAGRLYLFDLEARATEAAADLRDALGVAALLDGHLSFSADSQRLAFSCYGSTQTSDIYLWGLGADNPRAVTRASHGGLKTDTFVAPELVHYPTFDGREIPAWFYPPGGSEDAGPAVVIVHGGPEGQSRPNLNFLAQYLLGRGYAVLVPNVRGSTGYGNAYSHLDDVDKRLDAVADLAQAAAWLGAQAGVAPNRIAVYGGSYGGFMVLAALTTYPEVFAAGVDIVGISNFVTFLENTSGYRRAHREAEYGSLARDRALLEAISPLTHVDQIRAPLMVIHGANDPRVPLGEAEQLVAALSERGVEVAFRVFGDEGHGLVKLANKRVAYPAIVDFLDAQLGQAR